MLDDRALIRLSGDDPRGFLQGLVTNDTALLAPDRPLWAALLTPQGKVLFDFILWADGDDVLIDAEATQAEALAKRLSLYRLRRAITIAPDARAVHWTPNGDQGVPDPRLPELGRRWLGASGEAATGWLEHRLRLGVTEGVGELGSGETLWLEANAGELNGVSFTKGCYVGQENTARMHHRAKVNRRLVVAPLAESEAIARQADMPADLPIASKSNDRARARYHDLGLMVEHRRVEALGDALMPPWLAATLG